MSNADFPTPAEIDGFWMFDQVHAPRPLTRLSQEIVMRPMGEGFCVALAEVGCPFGLDYRAINEFAYFGFVPVASASSGERYRANVEALLPRLAERWEREWLPAILPGLQRLRRTDYAALADAALLAALETSRDELTERFRVHGFMLFSYQAASMFEDFYRATFNPADASEPYQMLQGYPTKAHEAQCGLWELGRRIRASTALRRLFAGGADIHRLRDDGECRDFLAALTAYLEEFGWRSDACIELAMPMWHEDPTPALNALAGLSACDDSESPMARLERVAGRRERLLRVARDRLAEDPQRLARFESLWATARHHVVLDENHNFYIDQMGNGGMRMPVLELGRRLADRGSVASRDDVFLLEVNEIRRGLSGESLYALAQQRRTALERWAAVAPPRTVGTPPEQETDDPLIVACIKTDLPPAAHVNAPGIVRGTAASPGLARGRAKVALSLAQASTIRPGEILVCEMTLPPWSVLFSTAAAVVADTGGVLSHCATVARECGIPCVVGTTVGTTTIRDGMELLVDGNKGEVLMLQSLAA
jgi:pyruvate,water dikinase